MQVNATFVQSGTYRHRQGKWELVSQEMALPSRLEVKLPANIQEQLETAKGTYHRFGQYSTALALIRKRIESQPVEKSDLEKICSDLSIPSGIDVSSRLSRGLAIGKDGQLKKKASTQLEATQQFKRYRKPRCQACLFGRGSPARSGWPQHACGHRCSGSFRCLALTV